MKQILLTQEELALVQYLCEAEHNRIEERVIAGEEDEFDDEISVGIFKLTQRLGMVVGQCTT